MPFLPVNKSEMMLRGWDRPDFVYVSGDAYVDHPSFGHAIITRMLESRGYKVGMLAQPDWKNIKAFKEFGRPRLGFLVSSGNIDSMVNAYTAARRPRSRDVYSPGGKTGLRPNRADIVYTNCIRQAYKNIPVILGGVEASCAVWLITTIGRIRCALPYLLTAARICCFSAWEREAS